MSVVVVGGNDRMATRYKDICKSYNCKAKHRNEKANPIIAGTHAPALKVYHSEPHSHQ